jgi:AcrR family transcriptional regulator
MIDLAQAQTHSSPEPEVRRRIFDSAYDLFSERGVHAVGIDEVIEKADVAKAALYRHFPSKHALVLAFLQHREQRWTYEWLAADATRRGSTAQDQLLAIFAVFDEWFRRDDFEGCSFINVLLEMGAGHPLDTASAVHLENIRSFLGGLAVEAGIADPDAFARTWHILMKGAIVAAMEGDTEAAQRAKSVARLLLAQHN